jgi:hypothetical protein
MRRVLAALLVFVFSASAASMTCAGWQETAAGRMACCRSAHDRCDDQLSADACCARTEAGRHQLLMAISVLPVSLAVVAVVLPHSLHQQPRLVSAAAFEFTQRRYPQSPPFPQHRPSDLSRPPTIQLFWSR